MADPVTSVDSAVEFINLLSNLGALGAIVVYFVLRDKRQAELQQARDEALSNQALERESKLSARLNNAEDFQRNELSGLIRDSAKVISENTTVLNRIGSIINQKQP